MKYLIVVLLVLLLVALMAVSRWSRIRAHEQAARRSGPDSPSGPQPGP
ncbi:MAG: hypothetical protein ACQERF_09910 [Actinomycetota bacterium]